MLRDQLQGLHMGVWDPFVTPRYLRYLHRVGRWDTGPSGTSCFLEWQLQIGEDKLNNLEWNWSLCTLVTALNNYTVLVVLSCLRLPNCSLISQQ